MKKSGFKFGLIGPASKLNKSKDSGSSGGKLSGGASSKPPPRRRPQGATAVFDTNSDEEGEEGEDSKEDPNGVAAVNRRLVAISAKQEKLAKKEYEDALAANPSVFDYDRAYESMQESRESKAAAVVAAHEKEKRQPKYIGNLLQQAKLRAIQSDRVYERKLQKEREEQDKLEGEATMKFVTSAYKKKLIEQQKWEVQQKLEEDREEKEDVTKTGMKGFYSSLLTKNIAMGGDVEKSAHSAFTTGSKRFEATNRYDLQEGRAKSKDGVADRREGNSPGDSAGGGGSVDGTDATNKSEASGSAEEGETEDDGATPSARLVDPRASSSSKRSRETSGVARDNKGSHARRAPERDASSDSPPHGKGSEMEMPGGDVDGVGGAHQQEHVRSSDDKDAVAHRVGGKRPRQECESTSATGNADGEMEQTEGKGTPSQRRDEGHDDASAAGRRALEGLNKAREISEAKAKKDAAIKAARERYLARRKAS